ncbi:MAG: carbon-nitrogen hydrolase family protein [Sphingobacteriales bacterium]|nr:carbon-nitrogen hydrolase family protein [Sphingobacteriales bacterium]
MILCIGQTKPVKGDIRQNIEIHKKYIAAAIDKNADLIIFPELSLTGYEPALARELATTDMDGRLDIFQELSDTKKIIIGAGVPTINDNDLFISMIIFQPGGNRLTYSKQFLYPGEEAVFTAGQKPAYISFDDQNIIAPAICYELSNPGHAENAKARHATIYFASVLNSIKAIDGDIQKLSEIAQKHKMTVFMANYTGESGGYECAGRSSIWNTEGKLIGQLGDKAEGLLIYDTETGLITEEKITT